MAILKNIPHTARRMPVNILWGFLVTFCLLSCAISPADKLYNIGTDNYNDAANSKNERAAANLFREAIKEFGKALDKKKDFRAYNNRGAAKINLGDFEGAIKDFKRAKELAIKEEAHKDIIAKIKKNLSGAEEVEKAKKAKNDGEIQTQGLLTVIATVIAALELIEKAYPLVEKICIEVVSWFK